MPKKTDEKEMFSCPVGSFFADMEKMFGKKSKFLEHMDRSKVEFLKGVRSLIDERIEGIEKKSRAGAGRKTTSHGTNVWS